jgi:hypothetical protein
MNKLVTANKQVNSNSTKLVRIDAGWLYYAKLEAVKQERSIKSLVEEGLEFVLGGNVLSMTEKETDDPRL